MKRVLSLVLAFVLVLGMVPAVNFASVDANIEKLVQLEIVKGGDLGLNLEGTFTRAELAVMLSRMNNVEQDAANYPGENPFSDMEGHWAANYVAYAANQGWVQGTGEGYNPNGTVTGNEVIVTSLRVLGFEYEGAWNDAEIAQAGAARGIAVSTPGVVKRGEAFQTHYVTLFVAENAEGVILAEKYNWVTPEVPVVTELKVNSVTADNLKEIVVEFNQPVDADTVVDANFAVNKDVKVSAVAKDATTVVLTVASNLKNQEAYELTVKNVQTVAGEKMEEAKVEFTAFDRELPEVVEVVVVGPRHFNIVFSEPIKTAGTVEIKEGNTTHGNTVDVIKGTNIVSVEAFTNFVEGRDYSVRVSGFEDFAEYKNVVTTREFTYNKDVNPPVATITKAEQEYIVVEFDKPVTGITAARFYHTFTAWNAVGVFHTSTFSGDDAKSVSSTEYVNKVFVQFHAAGNNDSRPLPEGTVNVGIRGANIQDRWTNKLGDQMIPVSIRADKTPLEITEIEVKSEDQLIVKFNKAVKEFTASNVEILDADGKEISNLVVTTATASNNRHGVINLSAKQAGKTLTVVIKNVEEIGLSSTRIASESRLVEVTDKTAPKVAEVYYNIKLAEGKTDEYANKELFVRFDEAVDGTTALVASNYALVVNNEDVTILTGTPSFDGNNTRVRIPLTNAQAHLIREGNTQGAQLQVINVKDIAGNTISPRIVDLNTNLQTDQFVKVTSVEATKTDTVVIKFNDTISGVTKDTFKLNGAGADAASAFTLTQTVERGVTVITLVHRDKFINTNANNVGLEINFAGLKNSFGSNITSFSNVGDAGFSQDATKATLTNVFIQDKIAPEVAKFADDHVVEAVRGKHNVVVTTTGSITITFTENIAADTVNRLTYSVQGANVQSATVVDGNTIVIDYTPVAGSTAIEKPRVTQNVKILDINGNSLLLTAPLNSYLPSDLVAN